MLKSVHTCKDTSNGFEKKEVINWETRLWRGGLDFALDTDSKAALSSWMGDADPDFPFSFSTLSGWRLAWLEEEVELSD